MNIKLDIVQEFSYNEPFWNNDDVTDKVDYSETNAYRNVSIKNAEKILSEIVDSPEKRIDDKYVLAEFFPEDKFGRSLRPKEMRPNKQKIEAIKKYYNFRFDMKKQMDKDIHSTIKKMMKSKKPVLISHFTYTIPEEYTGFTCETNDKTYAETKCKFYRIEVTVRKEK